MNALVGLFIGCPVHVKWDGAVKSNWVGYVRRINWDAGIAEVGPEACIGSHLRPYEFDRLVPAKFTRMMHPGLPAEIERLQRAPWSETGSKPNPSHHDGAAPAPSVDGVVGSLNQEEA